MIQLPIDPPGGDNHGPHCDCDYCEDIEADLADQARDDAIAEGLCDE